MLKLSKVISGGQDGADVAALVAASTCFFETGGWMPKGWRTESGPRPDYEYAFGMKEAKTGHYAERTRLNVRDSDMTWILVTNFKSPGTICTVRACEELNKPHFLVDLNYPAFGREILLGMLKSRQIETLNVAGNRNEYEKSLLVMLSVLSDVKYQQLCERALKCSSRPQP